MAGRLKDKVAIVTGAGSRGPGIGNGKAAAILFAREGANVLCVDADISRAEETVGQIEKESGIAEAFAADVVRAADCRAMVERAAARWGGLDILHNNVGVESRLDLMETTEQEWDRVMAIDLKSMLLDDAGRSACNGDSAAAARSPASPRSPRWSATGAPPMRRRRPA